jgi:hypothetical protein
MVYIDEYAVERRAALSGARLPAEWRSWMKQWSTFRRQAWKIDRQWTAHRLFVHAERLKGEGEWVPLPDAAPAEIILIDQCVAHLLGCSIEDTRWDREHWARVERRLWNSAFDGLDDSDWDGDYDRDRIDEEDRRLEEKLDAAREREGDLLLMHYLLPHVRLYYKLRLLKLSERAYYYRLNSALYTLDDEYRFRASTSKMCSRK